MITPSPQRRRPPRLPRSLSRGGRPIPEPISTAHAGFFGGAGFYLRVGMLAAVALTAFGILALRLWSLQVLQGPRYTHLAQKQTFLNTVDPEKAFVVFPEFQLPEDQKEAFRKQRNGAIAGVRLMQRFGWKIGDRITLMGTNYPVDLELVIVGGFTSINPPDEAALMFRWDYLDELAGRTGEAGWFTILARSREDMPRIIQAVDDMSRNSSAPTKTESEKEFQLSFSGMLGNIRFLVGSISAVVVFTILLVTAATMGMSIRERTAELGLLKSLGYSRGLIVGLLTADSGTFRWTPMLFWL